MIINIKFYQIWEHIIDLKNCIVSLKCGNCNSHYLHHFSAILIASIHIKTIATYFCGWKNYKSNSRQTRNKRTLGQYELRVFFERVIF